MKPFRFGVINESVLPAAEWLAHVRRIEALCYDTFLIRDHFVPDYFGYQLAVNSLANMLRGLSEARNRLLALLPAAKVLAETDIARARELSLASAAAAQLELDGTLAFAPGSAGSLSGSLQTIIFTDGGDNAEILNGGTLNAFIQSSGSLLMTGTNGIYITNAVQEGTIVGGESTYPRFYALNQNDVCEVINDTAHSLFLTSIIVSSKFWDGLDEELQTIVSEAALNAARFERKESVDDIALVQQRCSEEGIKIVTLPDDEVVKFKDAVQPVYAKYQPIFGDLVDRIRNA